MTTKEKIISNNFIKKNPHEDCKYLNPTILTTKRFIVDFCTLKENFSQIKITSDDGAKETISHTQDFKVSVSSFVDDIINGLEKIRNDESTFYVME